MSQFNNARLVQLGAAIAAALLVAGTAAPLQAAVPAGSTTANAQGQAQSRANPDRRICVRADLSGTRISRRVCKTRAEWDRDGGVPAN